MALTKAQLIDLNGNELILDLDADTSITADTDDQIDIKIAGADDFRFTANTFTALSGSGIVVPDGGLTFGSTAISATAAEINLIDGGASTGTTAVADADGIITNDGGTMRLTTAATFKTYFQEGISTAYDDLTTGDAAVNIATSAGNITIDAQGNDTDIIFKGTDGGADKTFMTIDGSAGGDLFLTGGLIDLKNDGSAVSQIKFYCESSNAHAQTLIGAPHSEAASNTLTLPGTGGDARLVSTTSTATLTNKTLTSPVITGTGAIASGAITSSGIIKTDDATEATSTTDGSLQTDGGLSVVKDIVAGDDIKLLSDAAVVHFGADSEVTLTHDADVGLKLKHTATADDKPIVLTLQTGETDMAANDVMGAIRFQAPDEGTGTDAILVAAAIQAVSEGDFSSSNNATRLEFHTGASEAASSKMTLSSAGLLTIADDLVIKDGGTIGSASDTGAIAIGADGDVTLQQDLELQHDGAILSFGTNDDVSITHVHNTGLLINSTRQLQFNDASQNINAPSNAILDINATDEIELNATEIELNATTVDLNGNLDVSGTYTGAGLMTTGGNIVVPDGGNIGSASDTDAITIASNGELHIRQPVGVVSAPDLGAGIHIKTADSGGGAEANADELVVEGSGNTGISILSGNTSVGAIHMNDDGGNERGALKYDHNADALQIKTAGAEQVRIFSNGVMAVEDGIALGVGIANTSSNVLDDYEVGTFTPTYVNQAGTQASNYTNNSTGQYIKVGKMVWVNVSWSMGTISSGPGSLYAGIGGFPFVADGSAGGAPWYTNIDVSDGGATFQISNNYNYGIFYSQKDNANYDTVSPGAISSNDSFYITFVYKTD